MIAGDALECEKIALMAFAARDARVARTRCFTPTTSAHRVCSIDTMAPKHGMSTSEAYGRLGLADVSRYMSLIYIVGRDF